MHDQDKTKEQLIAELEEIRLRVAQAENAERERRRAAEEEVAESKAILQAALECLPFEFFAVGKDGRYILQNATLREHYGEAIGRRPQDYAPDEAMLQLWLSNNRRAMAGERVEGEVEIHIDGVTHQMYNIIVPIHVRGTIVGILGVNIDITERKRAEAALQRAYDELEEKVERRTAELSAANERLSVEIGKRRESEERYELAVRSVGVGIWDYDIRTGKVFYSPRWKQLLGFEPHEIGDSIDDWARLLHPEERDWILKFQDDFLAGEEHRVSVEYRLRHKDGSYRWIVAHGLIVRDEQGKAIRLVGSHGDITDRKRAEAALEREHRTLKHLLQSSDHERQMIAYEIHDGLAQELAGAIMQFQAYDHSKDVSPQDAARAFQAGMAMLGQSHSETRRLISGVRPPILDEAGIVAAVAHLINEERRRKGPAIEFLSRVEFDRLTPILENAVYRITQEALANACHHSKAAKVYVELAQYDDQLVIEVRDQGVGFKPEEVGESRFGLEGIRERARLLGGSAVIETKPGQGTRVTVVLPIVLRRPDDESAKRGA